MGARTRIAETLPHPSVSLGAGYRVVDVAIAPDLARNVLDEFAARIAPRHEARQEYIARKIASDELGQDDCVLDRHGRALRYMRARRVRRITNQEDAATVPRRRQNNLLDWTVNDARRFIDLVSDCRHHRSREGQ